MPGHLAYNPATGHLVYSPATGHLAFNCGGADCEYCPDSTPRQYDVTFTDVVVRSSCLDGADESGYATSGSLSGTYRLTQDGSDPCLWLGTAAISASIWTGSGCSGSPIGSTTQTAISLRRTQEGGNNGWYLLVEGSGSGFGGFPRVQYFQHYSMVTSTNCASSLPSFTNDLVAHGIFMGTYTFGKDGSASLAVV